MVSDHLTNPPSPPQCSRLFLCVRGGRGLVRHPCGAHNWKDTACRVPFTLGSLAHIGLHSLQKRGTWEIQRSTEISVCYYSDTYSPPLSYRLPPSRKETLWVRFGLSSTLIQIVWASMDTNRSKPTVSTAVLCSVHCVQYIEEHSQTTQHLCSTAQLGTEQKVHNHSL